MHFIWSLSDPVFLIAQCGTPRRICQQRPWTKCYTESDWWEKFRKPSFIHNQCLHQTEVMKVSVKWWRHPDVFLKGAYFCIQVLCDDWRLVLHECSQERHKIKLHWTNVKVWFQCTGPALYMYRGSLNATVVYTFDNWSRISNCNLDCKSLTVWHFLSQFYWEFRFMLSNSNSLMFRNSLKACYNTYALFFLISLCWG